MGKEVLDLKIKTLRIIRPLNCLMASLAVFIGIIISSNFLSISFNSFKLIFALFSAFLLTAAGNVINDYFDFEIDKKNAPKRPLPSGELSKKTALILSALLFITGNIFSYYINLICFLLTITNSILLFLYARDLKGVPLAGNLVVSYLVGSTFLFGGLVVGSFEKVIILSSLAILATAGREIAKDIEDIKGDKEEIETIATKFGKKKSTYLAVSFTLVAISLSPLPFYLDFFGINYLISVFLADLLFIYAIKNLLINKSIESASKFQKFSKYAMIVSMFSFLVGSLSLL